MAGHSKWAQIKRAKGANDAKRSKVFAKLAKEVTIAVREGGGEDPDMNPRLRMVLLKCKGANMPADNIERAIRRGSGGGDSARLEELTYEVFGPGGVAILVEITTDNRNRTAAEIRNILNKNGGSMATSGAVTRLFHRRGQIIIPRENAQEDTVMEIALEAGAEDFQADPEGYEILTAPAQFETVHRALELRGIECAVAGVTSLPLHATPVDAQTMPAVQKLIEALEDHDDSQDVFTNADFTE